MSEFWTFMQVNRRLLTAVAAAVAGLLLLQGYVLSAQMECLGLAEAEVINISFDLPVSIKRIFVSPGQRVKRGQPLLEVEVGELNLKLLELQTAAEALESEQSIRDHLIRGLTSSGGKKGAAGPIEQEIAGLHRQINEVKRQLKQSVRYAEQDGIIDMVNYRTREQVKPFDPVITMSSATPNLVYGFIHENRLAAYKVGDEVAVTSVADPRKSVVGKVTSLGSRIIPFPIRMQTSYGTTYWGRELTVALASDNPLLMGEKVSVRTKSFSSPPADIGFQAFADEESANSTLQLQTLAQGLDLEGGGLQLLADPTSALLVSDETGPQGSPFWIYPTADFRNGRNLAITGIAELDDVESITERHGQFYALSSMSKDEDADTHLPARDRLIRFTVTDAGVVVNRQWDFRLPLLEALRREPLLQDLTSDFDKLNVESLTFSGDDAFLALKEPQFEDKTSVVLKIPNLMGQLDTRSALSLQIEVYSLLKLQDSACEKPSKISDLIKLETGLLILSHCSKSAKQGQVWWLRDNAAPQDVTLLASLRGAKAEGMTFHAPSHTLYISSDNGKKAGTDIFRVNLPTVR